VVTTEAALERRKRELAATVAALERTETPDPDADGRCDEETATEVEAEIALRGLRPGDVVIFDASNLRGRGLVLSTASRRSGIRVSVLTPSRKIVDITSKDLGLLPVRGARVDLPVPFEPLRTEFIREACARLVRARVVAEPARRVEGARSGPRSETPLSAAHVKRLRREIDQMEERSRHRSGSVGARFMDVVDLLTNLGYMEGWALTRKGEMLAGIFHESDLLVVEVLDRGVLDKLTVPDLVGVLAAMVHEPRGGLVGNATRWSSDQMHRSPHAGISWECAQWAKGLPLSSVLDPDLTPGDFVRTIRQIVDLLRQIGSTAPAELGDACAAAERAINRGVVAAVDWTSR
jgi:ATP-dependent RNA helicase HelY